MKNNKYDNIKINIDVINNNITKINKDINVLPMNLPSGDKTYTLFNTNNTLLSSILISDNNFNGDFINENHPFINIETSYDVDSKSIYISTELKAKEDDINYFNIKDIKKDLSNNNLMLLNFDNDQVVSNNKHINIASNSLCHSLSDININNKFTTKSFYNFLLSNKNSNYLRNIFKYDRRNIVLNNNKNTVEYLYSITFERTYDKYSCNNCFINKLYKTRKKLSKENSILFSINNANNTFNYKKTDIIADRYFSYLNNKFNYKDIKNIKYNNVIKSKEISFMLKNKKLIEFSICKNSFKIYNNSNSNNINYKKNDIIIKKQTINYDDSHLNVDSTTNNNKLNNNINIKKIKYNYLEKLNKLRNNTINNNNNNKRYYKNDNCINNNKKSNVSISYKKYKLDNYDCNYNFNFLYNNCNNNNNNNNQSLENLLNTNNINNSFTKNCSKEDTTKFIKSSNNINNYIESNNNYNLNKIYSKIDKNSLNKSNISNETQLIKNKLNKKYIHNNFNNSNDLKDTSNTSINNKINIKNFKNINQLLLINNKSNKTNYSISNDKHRKQNKAISNLTVNNPIINIKYTNDRSYDSNSNKTNYSQFNITDNNKNNKSMNYNNKCNHLNNNFVHNEETFNKSILNKLINELENIFKYVTNIYINNKIIDKNQSYIISNNLILINKNIRLVNNLLIKLNLKEYLVKDIISLDNISLIKKIILLIKYNL